MLMFVIEAIPGPDAEVGDEAERQNIGGAYVNCWIDYKNYEGAEHLAVFYIRDRGWVPGEVLESYELDKNSKGDDAEYIAEAAGIGYSLVFNCYPPGTEESAEDAP